MDIFYTPQFVRQLHKLNKDLQTEAIEKITLFRDTHNHRTLEVHKLHGHLAGRSAFSVNFKYRILFRYLSKTDVALLAIGDHEVYK
jgi:plasmid maintenance system killer protein